MTDASGAVTIRAATPDDARAIAGVHVRYVHNFYISRPAMPHWIRNLVAAALLAGASQAHATHVSLGYVNLSFYEVTASLVQQVLEHMGAASASGAHA